MDTQKPKQSTDARPDMGRGWAQAAAIGSRRAHGFDRGADIA